MPYYIRLAHLKDLPLVKEGQWVKRGQQIGYCGTSGASSGPHLHIDILKQKPSSWTFYVYGMSKAGVASWFADPAPYFKGNIPMANDLPYNGYRYLQGVFTPSTGYYYHSGIDANTVNDYGKPVYSPVEGRVVFVQGLLGKVWNRIYGWLNWGKGFGYMVVIEQDPAFKL